MGQRFTNPVFLSFVIFVCLFSIPRLSAQEAALTFPDIAAGQGISAEINLTNPAPHIERGTVLFINDAGEPMSLFVDGIQTSRADFSLVAGGSKKFRIQGADATNPQVGYALVVAENTASSLVGNLVFTINDLFDLSIPDSRPATSARLFVERSEELNSGYAILNRNNRSIKVSLVARDENGVQIGEKGIELGPGEKERGFLDFVGVPSFVGSLEVSADSPLYVIGLRQRRTGSLAALPAAVSAGPIVGSQLLYFLDSGVDVTAKGYSQEALKKTVYELTGLAKPEKPTTIKISNNNRSQAVTVHVYFLNDKNRDYMDFLLVLKCGETLTFDPFDFEIPGAGGVRTSNVLFGYGVQGEGPKLPAAEFGSGRFVLSVLAVANPLNPDDPTDDILYPEEVAMAGVCGVTPRNTGSQSGLSPANLHVYNALPIVFDYLSGNHVNVSSGVDGPIFSADAKLEALSAFTRTLVPNQGYGPQNGFVTLADPGNSDLFNYMAGQKGRTAGTVLLPSTAVFTWGSAPFTFLPGGR